MGSSIKNCYGRNVSKLEGTYSAEDLARAKYCGLDSDLANQTRWVNYFQKWQNNSQKVWCNSTKDWHYMDCEGRVGVVNFTCPIMIPVSSCLYWDTTSLSWSSEGCTYWRTDEVNGVAYCNCTHLTSFRSNQLSGEQESVSSFATTAASVQDLDGSAVQKNMVSSTKELSYFFEFVLSSCMAWKHLLLLTLARALVVCCWDYLNRSRAY